MLRAGEAVFVMALAALFIFYIIWQQVILRIVRAVQKRRPWKVDKLPLPKGTQVILRKPGEKNLYIGRPISLDQPAWEYDDKLIERKIDAADKAAALNRKL